MRKQQLGAISSSYRFLERMQSPWDLFNLSQKPGRRRSARTLPRR